MRYLFLVPKYAENLEPGEKDGWGNYEGWQIGTRDGKVITTDETEHFSGQMPLVEAGEIFLNTVPNEDLMAAVEALKDEN